MHFDEQIRVAITGTLQMPRTQVAELINATRNARFVEYITLETHYLVCEKHDSKKAKKAARIGTTVISEAELQEYLASGEFPSTKLPTKRPHLENYFPEITWTPVPVSQMCLITYCDAQGDCTMRKVVVVSKGVSLGYSWVGAYDGPKFKSWREDRIRELEILHPMGAGW